MNNAGLEKVGRLHPFGVRNDTAEIKKVVINWKESLSIQKLLDVISPIIAEEYITVAKQNPEVFTKIASGASRPRNDTPAGGVRNNGFELFGKLFVFRRVRGTRPTMFMPAITQKTRKVTVINNMTVTFHLL